MVFLFFIVLSVVPTADRSPRRGEYEFVPDVNRGVSLRRGETYSIGKLDRAGNFIPDPRCLNWSVHVNVSTKPRSVRLNGFGNRGRETVFEYRSDRLIKGELDRDGNFIPELNDRARFSCKGVEG